MWFLCFVKNKTKQKQQKKNLTSNNIVWEDEEKKIQFRYFTPHNGTTNTSYAQGLCISFQSSV